MKQPRRNERQLHNLAVLMDGILSKSDVKPRYVEQLNLAVSRLLLVHILSQRGMTNREPLVELLSSRHSRTGDLYSRFLQMFKTREYPSIQTWTHDGLSELENYLRLSPLGIEATESPATHLLSDDKFQQFADAIDRIDMCGPPARNPIEYATLLGRIYELLKDRAGKKEGGIFYTPYSVASMICDLSLSAYQPTWSPTSKSIERTSLNQLIDLRVVDNACGCGVFLVTMLDKIIHLLERACRDIPGAAHTLDARGASSHDRPSLARYVMRNSLHGRDLDRTALRIAKTQLWLAVNTMQSDRAPLPAPETDLVVMDSLLPDKGQADTFDIVVGNPPYMKVSSLPEGVKSYLRDRYPIHGEYNSHALFVHSGLRQLKKDGVLAYIVHKNIFTLDSFRDLRHLLLDSCECTNLVDCGPGIFRRVTAETGIMVVRNSHPAEDSSIRLSKYVRSTSRLLPAVTFSQAEYLRVVRPWEYRYVLSISEEDRAVLSLLETLPRLDKFVSIRRGIETGRNKRYLSSSPDEQGNWIPVLRGKDISAFRARHRFYLNYRRDELSKPGPVDLLQTPKLVVQQNSRRPIASFDEGRFLVLNSATYVSEAPPDFLKSVCVFLNSGLVGWFFRKVVTNDAGLTVNILPNNLGLIPLPAHFDTRVFAWLCDMLTSLNGESEHIIFAEKESLQNAADAAVLESYFPQQFPRMRVTRILSSAARRPVIGQPFPACVSEKKLRAEVIRNAFDTPLVKVIADLSDQTH